MLHALKVCDTVRTLLDVRNPTREPLDLIPTPHGVSIAHKAVGFSPGSVLTAFLLPKFMQKLVVEPDRQTEFEVQAYLWSQLRSLGINVRGEVKATFEKRSVVRFDLVVFKDGVLQGIIEVKSAPIKHKTCWEQTRQGLRYHQFGVPVVIVYGQDQAEALIKNATEGNLFAGRSTVAANI